MLREPPTGLYSSTGPRTKLFRNQGLSGAWISADRSPVAETHTGLQGEIGCSRNGLFCGTKSQRSWSRLNGIKHRTMCAARQRNNTDRWQISFGLTLLLGQRPTVPRSTRSRRDLEMRISLRKLRESTCKSNTPFKGFGSRQHAAREYQVLGF